MKEEWKIRCVSVPTIQTEYMEVFDVCDHQPLKGWITVCTTSECLNMENQNALFDLKI